MAARRRPSSIAEHRRRVGERGERLAARHYERRGGTVLARNWRCPEGELDIVIDEGGGAIVFVEVKSRSSDAFGHPAEAVDRAKQARIRRLARRWCTHAGVRPRSTRFDVVAVVRDRVEVIPDAF